jgi:hypothetical protein
MDWLLLYAIFISEFGPLTFVIRYWFGIPPIYWKCPAWLAVVANRCTWCWVASPVTRKELLLAIYLT